MLHSLRWLLALSLFAIAPAVRAGDVPKGEITKYTFDQSKIFPGTVRRLLGLRAQTVRPGQAGVRVRLPGRRAIQGAEVFDQLIEKKEMPVTIGVFVMHGRVKAPSGEALDRFNRSYEYDGPRRQLRAVHSE